MISHYSSIAGIISPLCSQLKLATRNFFCTVNSFNAHTILGLSRFSDEKQIKRAYYSLAKQYHPDSNPGQDTSAQFQKITKAYDLLIKEAGQRSKQENHNKQQSQKSSRKTEEGSNNEDQMFKAYQTYKKKHGIRSDRFDKFMEFYQDYTGQKKQSQQTQQKQAKQQSIFDDQQEEEEYEQQQEESEDVTFAKFHKHRSKKLEITIDLQLTREQAKTGAEKRFKIWKKITCNTCKGHPPRRETRCKKCNGSGIHISKKEVGYCWCCGGARTVSRHECAGCGGKGHISRQSEEIVHVRAGVENHQELIFRGKGHQHLKKGFFGDLIIKIRISGCSEESEVNGIKKVGFNTYQTVKISVLEAVLGTKLKYHTVWGQRTMPIRGGVQDGFVIKRNGQGCRKKSINDNGHHFITVTIEVPVKLSQAETAIYQRIREIYKAHKQHV